MNMHPIAGRQIEAADDKKQIIDLLREVANNLESGEENFNTAVLVFMDTRNLDEFTHSVKYVGRATANLAAIEIAKVGFMRDMGI